ncbi:MAG: HIT family protein [Chloroflexota bacterium]|nr:HIT family protein [Chloroflexota bacterium]MDE2649870.1 HIT family protein [Chloroflexota bacterium]MXX50821.1 HIT family protein [Chloroflexota bacterium]MYA91936.1 HIT family protein [Chloroflexota bacterium]MYD38717.1 HIT family protein [Chloroflexota bacterium]
MSCALLGKRDAGEAPPWDSIYRSSYWDVAHAYNTSVLGWLVLVVRRHIQAVDELKPAEAADLGALLREASLALKRQIGCQKTYVMQFAESADHPHVHFHIVPRMPDQAPGDIAYRVMRRLGVPLADRCHEADMNALALAIRAELESMR